MEPSTPDARVPLALVTGGARRLGKALALSLARGGYAVALHFCHSESQARVTADELRQYGHPVYLIQADLTIPSQIKTLFNQVAEFPHPLKVLVNSAGIMSWSNLSTQSAEEWDAIMALNLRAPFLCSQEAARLMAEGGLIVNISDAGLAHTWTGYPTYQVSKSGLDMLTRQLARSLAPKIRVNAIAPGFILKDGQTPSEEWERLVDRLPLKHSGDPRDVSQTLVFLLENEYITGQTIVVDGGYQLT